MALTGTWVKYSQIADPDNNVTQSITYPIDLLEDDPNYEKRGTTEEIVIPGVEEVTEEFENVYVIVTAASHWRNWEDNSNEWELNFVYSIYNSLEERNENLNSFIHQDSHIGEVADLSLSTLENAYTFLKSVQGFKNLVNA